jgi:hypothetical protein
MILSVVFVWVTNVALCREKIRNHNKEFWKLHGSNKNEENDQFVTLYITRSPSSANVLTST